MDGALGVLTATENGKMWAGTGNSIRPNRSAALMEGKGWGLKTA